MDGDGSFDPSELAPLLAEVARGRADLAVGRRRPVGRGVWPWHARLGNAAVVAWFRHRADLPVHDIAPCGCVVAPICWPSRSLDRRFGYPVELLQRATTAGWRIVEHDVTYRPRADGTRSKVSGRCVGRC